MFLFLMGGIGAGAFCLAGWSEPEVVSPPWGEWSTGYNFVSNIVATADGDLHVAFFGWDGGDVYHRRYDAAAHAWRELTRLDEGGGGRDAAIILGAAGEPHVFFMAGWRICHRIWTGSGWTPPEYLMITGWHLAFPSPLLLPDGDIALAFVGSPLPAGKAHIWFTTWREGSGFAPPERLSETTGPLGSWMPTLIFHEGILRCAWRDDSSGEFDVYERVREGGVWGRVTQLTNNPARTYHPRYAVDGGGTLRLFFMDARGGRPAIWEKIFRAGAWEAEHVLYDGGAEAYHPNVCLLRDGRLLLFWEDTRVNNQADIFYGVLTAGVWSEAYRVSRTLATTSIYASAAESPEGYVATVYTEDEKDVVVQRLAVEEVMAPGILAATAGRGGVLLTWDDPAGRYEYFDLFARQKGSPWRRVNAAAIRGRSPFRYFDRRPPGAYTYRLDGFARGCRYVLGTAAAVVTAGGGSAEVTVAVYPNPCRGDLNIKYDSGAALAEVEIFDLAGRRVWAREYGDGAPAGRATLSVGALPPGLYLLQLRTTAEEKGTARVVVAR